RRSLRQDFRNIHPESARIVLFEGSPDVLSTFPERLRAKARRSLERLGIEVKTDARVTAIDPNGVWWRPAPGPRSEPGRGDAPAPPDEFIAAQTVLWAAGVEASPLARALGVTLDRAGRVAVEP